MAKIPVPPTPKEAFDRNRPPSTLLRSHIEHLEHAVLARGRSIRTEGDAAEYIGQLTNIVRGGGAIPEKPKPVERARPQRKAKRAPRGK